MLILGLAVDGVAEKDFTAEVLVSEVSGSDVAAAGLGVVVIVIVAFVAAP